MASQRPLTPSAGYGSSVPAPHDPAHLSRGYGDASRGNIAANDFATPSANALDPSPLSQSLPNHHGGRRGRFEESFDATTRGSSILGGDERLERSASRASTLNQGAAPSRSGTLKKRSSVKRSGSLKRSGSRKSLHAGSIRGVSIEDDGRADHKGNSVFYTPVPTSGSPTDVLSNRFQAWRKLLKDLIAYFREIAVSYEHRGKALLKVSNVINNTNTPSVFLTEGGLNDANRILRDYHKQAVTEANKAKDIQAEVINQLSGLRADLGQKIKEIKSLSGDFKNSVEKEKENTRKCVAALEEALSLVDSDPAAIAGKGDPFVVRLGVDRQVERQIDEENYLHRAYLNLENSGRELESIVVGEIQKAYNALANILKHEADESYSTIERLRSGPVGMPRDREWDQFVHRDPHFVNPDLPLRRLDDIEYPGKHHPAAVEVRAGMLERKSKYLKSYTPGWYVLSPTHLHEFKSADRIYTQPPVMSLLLSDQKLGSHSQPGSSSHKFVLKGRQTGSMHRGHTWVFRAETYDTMLAWRDDIQNLIDKTGDERNAFVRRQTHRRSMSAGSARSISSGGDLEEDEADSIPFSQQSAVIQQPQETLRPVGGRFPSDLAISSHLQTPLALDSDSSSEVGHDITSAEGGPQGAYQPHIDNSMAYDHAQQPNHAEPYTNQNPYEYVPNREPAPLQQQTSYFANNPPQPSQNNVLPGQAHASGNHQPLVNDAQPPQALPPVNPQPQQYAPAVQQSSIQRHDSTYGDWMAPAAGAAGGVAFGALGADAHRRHQQHQEQPLQNQASAQQFREADALEGTTRAAPILERHPNHTAAPPNPATSAFIPIPVSAPVASEPDSLATTPSTNVQSFLGAAEVLPAGTSSKAVANGGADKPSAVRRQNTDMSVSDLHVPGEYPKVPRS
ncbi:hypothetical protein CC80DRAFT_412755 [Byssothecium circinans]|uniref:PH domain-containing protein n=1 Tax=Byssothecium circinans TaxID=147558 RepID=A0A6A5TX02_9PLEO|nr:hypothetical protein CC80DRAFT_412755 [Byssothecium circinans]